MGFSATDYPKPGTLKWAMLVVLLKNERPMVALEIDKEVAKLLHVSDAMFDAVLENGKRYLPYRLGWERTKCKKLGYLEKSTNMPRFWQLTEKGRRVALSKQKLF